MNTPTGSLRVKEPDFLRESCAKSKQMAAPGRIDPPLPTVECLALQGLAVGRQALFVVEKSNCQIVA
jgi:hypothetical protein